ncbi:hypothetical protein CSPX01_16422 [Colletotrichum filicis]|nr:hypothetical protein CSPX01_16422 [Colletotrichum filicis]
MPPEAAEQLPITISPSDISRSVEPEENLNTLCCQCTITARSLNRVSHSHRRFLPVRRLSSALGGYRYVANDAKGSKPRMDILYESELLRDETQDFDKQG